MEGFIGMVRAASTDTERISKGISVRVEEVNESIDKLAKALLASRGDMARIATCARFGKPRESIDIPKLMMQHLLWVIKARLALDGRLPQEAKSLGDHSKCDLGKWMASAEAEEARAGAGFSELDAKHKELHALANEIIGASGNGAEEENEAKFDSLLEISKTILALLPGIGARASARRGEPAK